MTRFRWFSLIELFFVESCCRSGDLRMRTVQYLPEANIVRLIDQTKLPAVLEFVDCSTWQEVASAIREMRVRGAPALGVTGAYGLALAALRFQGDDPRAFEDEIQSAAEGLSRTRPTAVNLFWGLEQGRAVASRAHSIGVAAARRDLVDLAERLADEDVADCHRIGAFGAELVPA